MENDGDKVWMTEEETNEFYARRLEISQKLNAVLMELCLLLLKDKNENQP